MIRFVALSAMLFAIGAYGVMTRRNAICTLLGLEIMLNAANLNLIAFSRTSPSPEGGLVFAVFSIGIAGCEAAVGLALILALSRRYRTIDVDKLTLLKE